MIRLYRPRDSLRYPDRATACHSRLFSETSGPAGGMRHVYGQGFYPRPRICLLLAGDVRAPSHAQPLATTAEAAQGRAAPRTPATNHGTVKMP